MATTIIVSPWGSDVLRLTNNFEKKRLAKVFKKASYIIASPTGNIGSVIVNDMKIDKKKLFPIGWGSETIDYINEHLSEVTTENAKEQLNLKGRYLITCGYNAFESQRHETIIQAINNIRNQLPQNYTLVFPVTYGTSNISLKQEYVNRLKSLCENLKLQCVFYEDYLSVHDLFLLRRATDMFIHIQTTDGGNSSLQEYVLCGKKVIHGSWIHYKKLEQFTPLFYFPVDDINHLSDVILNAYHSKNINTPQEVLSHIRNRGWKAKMEMWNDFFISCCHSQDSKTL